MNNIISFGGKYFFKDAKQTLTYRLLCEKMISKLTQNIVIVLCVLLISYGLMGIVTLYMIVIKRQRITFVGTEIPFTNIRSDIGFVINLIEQLFLALISIIFYMSVEIGSCLVQNVFEMFPEIIRLDIQNLNEDLERNGMDLHAKSRLIDIFMKIQDCNE